MVVGEVEGLLGETVPGDNVVGLEVVFKNVLNRQGSEAGSLLSSPIIREPRKKKMYL